MMRPEQVRILSAKRGLRPLILLGGVALATLAVVRAASLGPLSHHMIMHILLMNAAAPVIAFTILREWRLSSGVLARGETLIAATVGQILLLWLSHAPVVLDGVMTSPIYAILISSVLAASALLFWASVLSQCGAARWRAIAALLLTGKLFCLLAVLLVFAARSLYNTGPAALGHDHSRIALDWLLNDQQLAGLLMIVVCPVTYVAAATWIAALWLREEGAADPAPARPPSLL
jgi:putative membrane protein